MSIRGSDLTAQAAQRVPRMPIDEGNERMRSEAAARGQTHSNWIMAALITANGGAILALLGQPARQISTGVALALFAIGVTCALVAGKLAANLAQEAEALFVSLKHYERAVQHRFDWSEDPRVTADAIKIADELVDSARAMVTTAEAEYDAAVSPDYWLAAGIGFFFFGCIAAGLSLFGI